VSHLGTCPLGLCVLRNLNSPHKHKMNHHLPCKHLHQLKMRIRLKLMKMKIKKMSHLKRRTLIKGEMTMKTRKMNKRFGIKDRHTLESTKQFKEITPINSILGDIHKGVTTRSRVAHFCEHYSFVSSIEPYRIEDALRYGLGGGYARRAQQIHEE
jgi:hypothetical protein